MFLIVQHPTRRIKIAKSSPAAREIGEVLGDGVVIEKTSKPRLWIAEHLPYRIIVGVGDAWGEINERWFVENTTGLWFYSLMSLHFEVANDAVLYKMSLS